MAFAAFMPHGHCYLWSPTMIALQAISDFSIGCAYLFISAVLFRIFRSRKERFNGVVLSFGIFILACGGTISSRSGTSGMATTGSRAVRRW